MKFFWGLVEIDKDLLLGHSTLLFIFFIFLFFLTTVALVKLAFKEQIIFFGNWIKTLKKDSSKKRHPEDWTAQCTEREGWKQKAHAQNLDLEGQYLKKLSFSVKPIGKPENWRAGFMLGNEKFRPQDIVDTQNAITIHTGEPPLFEKGVHVWKYDENHPINHGEECAVVLNDGKIKFDVEINKNKSLSVFVGGQLVYHKTISFSLRRKLYLLAWADNFEDCKIKFEDIKYSV